MEKNEMIVNVDIAFNYMIYQYRALVDYRQRDYVDLVEMVKDKIDNAAGFMWMLDMITEEDYDRLLNL